MIPANVCGPETPISTYLLILTLVVPVIILLCAAIVEFGPDAARMIRGLFDPPLTNVVPIEEGRRRRQLDASLGSRRHQ